MTAALEIIDRIPAHIVGAPDKIVAIDPETGKFGVARPSAVHLDDALIFPTPPAGLAHVIAAARAIVSGDPRAITAPGVTLGLAVGAIACAWKLGHLAQGLENLAAENQALAQELEELRGATAFSHRGRRGVSAVGMVATIGLIALAIAACCALLVLAVDRAEARREERWLRGELRRTQAQLEVDALRRTEAALASLLAPRPTVDDVRKLERESVGENIVRLDRPARSAR